jgi:hypothetical protein
VSAYVGPFKRVDTAKGHHYLDANRRRVPGVTTILSDGLPKAALINWAGNATAEYAVDNWDDLSTLAPSARLKKLQKARYEDRDKGANRGTEIHKIAEPLIRGDEVDVPEELAGHVESYVQFLDEFNPIAVLVETTVYSVKHGYCGTLDTIFDFPGGLRGFHQDRPRILVDLKTNRSGIFGETSLQLAGYRYAETYLGPDGTEQPMIGVDGCAAIHVKADGFELRPVTAGQQQFRDFLYAQQIRRFDAESRDLIGPAIDPPSRVQRRRLEIASDPKDAS